MDAQLRDDVLTCPLVGRFEPVLSGPTLARPGLVLGHVRRLGKLEAVTCPEGARGLVVPASEMPHPLEWGAPLARLEAMRAGGADALLPEDEAPGSGRTIDAPIDGIVYLKPAPEAQPFVVPGQALEPGATVALVEVMKTFHPVRLEGGPATVERLLVQDGQEVASGEALVLLQD